MRCPYCAYGNHLLLGTDGHIRKYHAFLDPSYNMPPVPPVKEEYAELTEKDIKPEIKIELVSL
jgi:hypothetical protein